LVASGACLASGAESTAVGLGKEKARGGLVASGACLASGTGSAAVGGLGKENARGDDLIGSGACLASGAPRGEGYEKESLGLLGSGAGWDLRGA
jgi:hypothetical protein